MVGSHLICLQHVQACLYESTLLMVTVADLSALGKDCVGCFYRTPAAKELCFPNSLLSGFFSRGQLVPVVRGEIVHHVLSHQEDSVVQLNSRHVGTSH